MDGEIDYKNYDESELVDMFSRTDPRWAPINCARLKELLLDRGYIVRDGGLGPGSAVPSPEKLQSLIGSARPIECKVTFGQKAGLFRRLEPSHNDFDFGDSGTLAADGIHLRLSGRRAGLPGLFGTLFERNVQLNWRGIVNVESDENVVHFAYHTQDAADNAITLWLPDRSAAERLATVLPKERTADFRPQLKVHADFERNLIAQSPKTLVTVVLVAINALVFTAMGIGGAGWFTANPVAHVAWGSNFGPYTADGEWWRLFTSLFIHFGVLHLLFNMWALGIFGPLVERLYGSINYLCIYLASGLAGSLASLSWHPELNSAGASGAILGILGAMLAAQLRSGESFPSNIVRPLRDTTLVFLGWTLYAGFTTNGIDNAAHLGGLGAGFLIGLAAARPVTGESSYSRSDLRRLIQLTSISAVVLAVGFWFAQRASASMVGEELYRRTAHWIGDREPIINGKFNAALSLDANDRQNHSALIETLEKDVIPFWREAGDRLVTIQLSSNSANRATLEVLQDLTHGRADAYQSLDDGLRRNDPETIAKAGKDLNQVEQTAKERRATRQ
jgi:rhomboid protease GluP